MTTPESHESTDGDFVANTKETVRLLEADIKAGTELIARILTLRTATRGVVVSLGSALFVYSLTNHTWPAAAVGILVAAASLLADAYSEFIQNVAHNRLTRLEHKVQSYLG